MCCKLYIAMSDNNKHTSAPPLQFRCGFMVRYFVQMWNKLLTTEGQEDVSPWRSSIFRSKSVKSDYNFLHVCHSAWNNSTPIGGILVTIRTTSLIFANSTSCPHCVFMCFVWIWEQTAIISLYRINWLVFITQTECV